MRFQISEYGDDKIVKEAKQAWFPISSTQRLEYAQSVQATRLEL